MSNILSSDARRFVRREMVKTLIGEGVIGRRQGRAILAEAQVRDNFNELLSDLRDYLTVLRDDAGEVVMKRGRGYPVSRMFPGELFPGPGVRFHVGIRPIVLFQMCGIAQLGGGKTAMSDKLLELLGDEEFSADGLLNDPDFEELRKFIEDNFTRASLSVDQQTLVADFTDAHGTASWGMHFARPVKTQSGRVYVRTMRPHTVQEESYAKKGGFLEFCKEASDSVFGDPGIYEAVYRLVNNGDLWTNSPDTPARQAPSLPPGHQRQRAEPSLTHSSRISRDISGYGRD